MSQLMMVDQLLPFTARSSNTVEQTLFEQLFVPDYHTPDARAAQMRLLAERFSRSLLSFLAPLVALLGVALTNRTDQLVRAAAFLPGADGGESALRMGDHHRGAAQRGRRPAAGAPALWRRRLWRSSP